MDLQLSRHAAAFFASMALGVAGCSREPKGSPTVVLISIDTLRAERLGVYGNSPDVSPAIDALARESVVFDQALSVAPWTLPSHASMLTGLDAVAHGVEAPEDRIPTRATTLAEHFAAHGYRTAAWTAGGFVGPGWGLEDGFEVFDTNTPWITSNMGFSRHLERTLEWMRENSDEPYFLFLHSFDAHGPYKQSDPELLARFRQRPVGESERDHEFVRSTYTRYARSMGFDRYLQLDAALNDYDSGVAEADRAVGRILDELRASGRYDEALIVVLSDHGEAFYDRGLRLGHGMQLYDCVLRVPLIVKLPRSERGGTRVGSLVDLVDIAPTLLDVAGLPPDARMQGSSLAQLARGGRRSRSYSMSGTHATATHALVRDGYKYIDDSAIPPVHSIRVHIQPETPPLLQKYVQGDEFKTLDEHGVEIVTRYPVAGDPLGYFEDLTFRECLFERASDPDERHNLAAQRPEALQKMRDALAAIYSASKAIHADLESGVTQRELNSIELRQLRELGDAVGNEPDDASRGEMDLQLAEARTNPPLPPPNSGVLVALDQRVHRVRLALRERGELTAEALGDLEVCAGAVLDWLESTGDGRWALRALWRLVEIEELSRAAGHELDSAPLHRRLRRFVAPFLQKRPAGEGSAEPRER
jgi:arylsulfatase A-like enzyme